MTVQILVGDCRDTLKMLPDGAVQCVVTSPPYWGLRDYGTEGQMWGGREGCDHVWGASLTSQTNHVDKRRWNHAVNGRGEVQPEHKQVGEPQSIVQGQFCQLCNAWRGSLGLEPTPALYVQHLVEVFREVKRVLRGDGTVWINLGDSYCTSPTGTQPGIQRNVFENAGSGRFNKTHIPGLKPKDLVGIPWRVAFALQDDGWWLRSDIIWNKPNCMPESVTDRPTKSHEYVFLLSKSARYFYDGDAVREGYAREYQDGPGFGGFANRTATKYRDVGNQGNGPNAKVGAGRNRRTVWTIPTFPFSGWIQTSHLSLVGRDDVSDGTMRITSPGCPVHGCLDRPCDEHGDDDKTRKSHSNSRPEQEQPCVLVASSTNPDREQPLCNSNSQGQQYDPSATDHSTQNHRTGRAPGTSLAYMPCAEMTCHIDDRQGSHVCAKIREHMPDCKIWPGEMDARLLDQIPYHTVDKSSLPIPPECLCGFYHIVTKKSSHFATFPPALVKPMIKAGTSERGACWECGKAWVRVTEREFVPQQDIKNPDKLAKAGLKGLDCSNSWGKFPRGTTNSTTTGWRPGCDCYRTRSARKRRQQDALSQYVSDLVELIDGKQSAGEDLSGLCAWYEELSRHTWEQRALHRSDEVGAPVVPCRILDPFSGAGTVGLVCDRLGRDAILCELNTDYAQMSCDRIYGDAPMFAEVEILEACSV